MTTYAPGSGLGGSVLLGIETPGSYGTLASSLNKSIAFESFDVKPNETWVEGNGLHSGQVGRYLQELVKTKQDASGTAKSNFYYNNMLRMLGSLMGGLTTAPVQNGATTAYTTTFSGPVSDWNQSLSAQILVPDVAQAGHFWNVYGMKVTDAVFEIADGGPLTATWNVDARDYYETNTGTTPPAASGSPYFAWHQSALKIGAIGSEAKVDGIKKWNLSVKKGMDTARWNEGNVTSNPGQAYAVKDEPVWNSWADISGTLDTEYLNDSLVENYFTTGTPFSMIQTFTSATLAGTGFPYSVTFAMPNCVFQNAQLPSLTGPAIVQPNMPFKVYQDGTHPLMTITVVSQDATM